jgi:putative transcriptional regulator
MSIDSAATCLVNHFLIAMPGLDDAYFGNAVVFMCEHNAEGALGLVLNKPSELSMSHLFTKVDLKLGRRDLADTPVLQGGPVHTERGFVLHTAMADPAAQDADSAYASSIVIRGAPLEMTTSRDVLEALSEGVGPRQVLVTLGYASWSKGQLESEIADNTWLTVPADTDLIFSTPAADLYRKAMGLLGIEPWMIAPQAGRA